MRYGTNEHDDEIQQANEHLKHDLQILGLCLGVQNGNILLYLHNGKVAKVSVRLDLALTGFDELVEEGDNGEHDETAGELMLIGNELLRRLVERPLLRRFVRSNLETPICERVGNFGYVDVVMRNGRLKGVVMWRRANLAL